jgi:HAD superfamily hydrolase (TIGR01509 family)
MPLSAVIFDFDGVILETSNQLYQGYKRVFDRLDVEYTEKHFNDVYGLKTKEHFRKVLLDNEIDLSDEDLNGLVEERDIYYRQICSVDLEPLPGVVELLSNLKDNNISIGLATSTSRDNIDFFLPRLGILDYFDQLLAGTEVTKGKPDPEIYLKTCVKLGFSPVDCVGIEDTEIGVNALNNANMKSIAVTLTNRKKYDFSSADLVVCSLEEIKVEKIRVLFKN